jgi:hypothetical protein
MRLPEDVVEVVGQVGEGGVAAVPRRARRTRSEGVAADLPVVEVVRVAAGRKEAVVPGPAEAGLAADHAEAQPASLQDLDELLQALVVLEVPVGEVEDGPARLAELAQRTRERGNRALDVGRLGEGTPGGQALAEPGQIEAGDLRKARLETEERAQDLVLSVGRVGRDVDDHRDRNALPPGTDERRQSGHEGVLQLPLAPDDRRSRLCGRQERQARKTESEHL